MGLIKTITEIGSSLFALSSSGPQRRLGVIETLEIELVNNGAQNINGSIFLFKIGELVVMTMNEASGLTHDSAQVATSNTSVIPVGWRPAYDKRNTGQLLAGGNAHVITIGSDGSFNTRYISSTFGAVSQSSMGQQSISWIAGR